MTWNWLTVMEYLCHKWPRIYVPLVVNTSRSFPHSQLITGFITRLTQQGATNRAGNPYPSGAPDFTPSFQWGSGYSIFICMFCKLLFVLLSFFFWPLCCLFFFDIWIVIAPLVSSHSSYHFDKQIQVCTNEDLIVYGVWVSLIESKVKHRQQRKELTFKK